MLGRLRRFWLDVHLWIGVGLFVALVPIGLSGAFLVWHDQIDEVIHPQRFAVSQGDTALAASAYLDAAREAYGDRATVTQLRLPQEPGQPVVVSGRVKGPPPAPGQRPRSLTLWLDPATGNVLDMADPRGELIGVMHRLHGSLLIPGQGVGRKVVGWMGWAMSISCLTGLWLWWPRGSRILKGLRWRRSPSTMNNLHHLFGFWILVPLLLVSLTGVYISFPQTSRVLFGVGETPEAPRAQGKGPASRGAERGPGGANSPPLASPNLPIDMAVAAAMAEHPGGRLAAISLPTAGDRPAWRVQLMLEGQEEPVQVQVSDGDGAIRKGRGGGGPGQADPISKWMRGTHDAQESRFPWQVLVFLTGVAPPLLGITGTVMWLRRRSRRSHLKRLQAGSVE